MKVKQKYIKEMIRNGEVIDITNYSLEDIDRLGRLEKVCYSMGIYGLNGAVMKSIKNGKFYGVGSRCTNVFYL